MPNPFPPSALPPGHGNIHLSLLPPSIPTFSHLSYTYPLKLLLSTPHTLPPSTTIPQTPANVPLLFLLTYGGGLVAGDIISLRITLDPQTRLTIATQGSTKIFKAPSSSTSNTTPRITSRQDLHVEVGRGAGIWLGPDPTQPFAGSWYAQKQVFEVQRGGSVGMVDWVSEGRRARGEKWGFEGWKGKNEIWRVDWEGKKRLVLRDNVFLEGGNIAERMDGMGVIGTVILMGGLFEGAGAFFVEEFRKIPRIGGRNWGAGGIEKELSDVERWRKERLRMEAEDGVLWTAARVRGLVVVKFGAREVEGAKTWLRAMLREEGSLHREFGEGALMCVR